MSYTKNDWTDILPAAVKAKLDIQETGIKYVNDERDKESAAGRALVEAADVAAQRTALDVDSKAEVTAKAQLPANVAAAIEAGTATATPNDTDVETSVSAAHVLQKTTWAQKKAAILENQRTVIYRNLLNLADADYKPGYYIDTTNGLPYVNANYNTSGFIPVAAGQKIVLTVQGRYDFPFSYIAAYNSSKTVIPASGASLSYFYTVPAGVAFIRVSYDKNTVDQMVLVDSDDGVPDYFIAYGNDLPVKINRIHQTKWYLPSDIYVNIGATVELYFRSVCPDGYGKLNFTASISANNTSSVVTIYSDKIKILGNSAGRRILRINAYDSDSNKVFSKQIIIWSPAASTSTKKILPIGDSLSNSKAWLAEMIKKDTSISFVGNKSFSLADSGGVTRTGSHAGYSGWLASTFMTSASSSNSGTLETNPFWDASLSDGAGGFSFAYYVANSLGGVAPDIVQIFLGRNGLQYNPTNNGAYIKAMVDNIRAYSATMPIMLVVPQYPQFDTAPQEVQMMMELVQELYEVFAAYTLLYFVPLWLCHDSKNNYYSGATELVNPRSPLTQLSVADSTHPQTAGYYQFADVMFGVFSKYFTT